MRHGPLAPRQAREVINNLRFRVLPEIEREYAEAHKYVGGRRDRPTDEQSDYVSGGGIHSDPTGDLVAEQESNRDRLKSIGNGLEELEKDAQSLLGRLKGIFDVSEHGPLESARIPTTEEVMAQKDAAKNRRKVTLNDEKRQLENRLREVDRELAS